MNSVFKPLSLVVLVVLLNQPRPSWSHGRLRCPPGRSSMWRDRYPVPFNYQDNELNCGGRKTHWEDNGGKCGVCGDPYHARVQENQPPNGRFARGILAACYNASIIHTFVEITANHAGYVEFRLCPNDDFNKPVTQECLDRNVLTVRDKGGRSHGKRYQVPSWQRDLDLDVEVPDGITCRQCVLQWRYVAGNSWGCEWISKRRKRCGMGLGPQESFFNCADIAVLPDCGQVALRRPWSRSVCHGKQGGGSPIGNDFLEEISRQGGNRLPANPPGLRRPQYQDNGRVGLSGIFGRAMSRANNNNKDVDTQTKASQKITTESNNAKDSNGRSTASNNNNNTAKFNPTKDKEQIKSQKKAEHDEDSKMQHKPGSTATHPPEKEKVINKGKKETAARKSESEMPSTTQKPESGLQKSREGSSGWGDRRNDNPFVLMVKRHCYAIGIWSSISNMHSWCVLNCRGGNCPSFMCACDG